ncbi:MAG: FAD:protein FMN transferase [Gammaproteobacteria bacterium]|nr:FAD:protein FMN transferase [Gammaproteobacteria bacterium]
MTRMTFRIFFISALLLLAACDEPQYQKINGFTMGTSYQVVFKGKSKNTKQLKDDIERRLDELNQNLSTYIDDSDLMLLNSYQSTDCKKVTTDTLEVTKTALYVYTLSNGVFDPGLGPLIELWGFDRKDTHQVIPSKNQINEELSQLSFRSTKVDVSEKCIAKGSEDLFINLSAIAKGYAVDEIAQIVEGFEINNYMVEIGGELKTSGNNPKGHSWNIAIESPTSESRTVQKVINPGIMSVATSGDYRNYFEKDGKRYSHTIDPTTGYPIDHKLASVTVINESAMLADALATAIMVMGPERGLEFANANQIPVFLIVKGADEFIEVQNKAFEPYLKN